MRYILDTHVWIWCCLDSTKLSSKVESIINNNETNKLYISAISMWETAKLVEKGKLELNINACEWINETLRFSRIDIIPLTSKIVYQSTILPEIFHKDPADQIISATSIVEQIPLITKDGKLQNYDFLNTIW
jgi:PIN domain nuclease of toxin-antitoxin system